MDLVICFSFFLVYELEHALIKNTSLESYRFFFKLRTIWLNFNSADISVPKSDSVLQIGPKWLLVIGCQSKFTFCSGNSVKLTYEPATSTLPSNFSTNNCSILCSSS